MTKPFFEETKRNHTEPYPSFHDAMVADRKTEGKRNLYKCGALPPCPFALDA
jgi:hypothetical protein